MAENHESLTVGLLRSYLKVMAGLDLSAEAEQMSDLLAAIVAAMNTLDSTDFQDVFPAQVFRPIQEGSPWRTKSRA